jgi:hypothetical protein
MLHALGTDYDQHNDLRVRAIGPQASRPDFHFAHSPKADT